MQFDPKSFIQVSKDLESGQTEAHFRSIINRSYYAAFGYIRNSLGIHTEDGSVHQATISTLMGSVNTSHKIAAKRLETLFKLRKEADYKHNKPMQAWRCESVISDAEAIIKLFDTT
ncbi:MAG: HEPN domain-containing protein [Imperialibacter sp.]